MKFLILALFLINGFFVSCEGIYGSRQGLDSFLDHNESQITDEILGQCSKSRSFHQNKILFVVDKSKTSKKSDPDGSSRIQGLQDFIQKHKGHNAQFGFITFSSEIESPMTISQIPVFRSDPLEIKQALDQIASMKDRGKKNYSDLFEAVKNSIENDIRVDPLLNDYHILFISDGAPSKSPEEEIRFVKSIQTWKAQYKNIYMHSAYYGNYQNKKTSGRFSKSIKKGSEFIFKAYICSQTGLCLLSKKEEESQDKKESKESDDTQFVKSLAQSGHYVDYNQGSQFDFTKEFLRPWNMEFFIVYNLNAGFCFDGSVGVDSDSDGLCDQDEKRLTGFNPQSRFSFDDGYSDYFHWLALHQNQQLSPCSNREDKDHDLLTYCEEVYLNFISSDRDLKPLDPYNPDSDGDYLIDGIEAMVYLSKDPSAPMDPHNLKKRSGDGPLSDLEKIKRHLPLSQEARSLDDGTSLFSMQAQGASCYGLRHTNLSLYPTQIVNKGDTLARASHQKNENVILVYFVHHKQGSSDYAYQFQFKKLNFQESVANRDISFQISINQNQFNYYSYQKKGSSH